uniref:Uncharacterized protein n=1 Tax=Ditylenchus dipsaci TaxID=166011 RepID=A0A915EUI4_9BILA
MSYKYKFNIDLMPEKICGRGYADLIVLIMGKKESKSSKAVPSILEFKINDNEGPIAKGKNIGRRRVELGLDQIIAKGYAYTRPNIRTLAEEVVMIGVAFNRNPEQRLATAIGRFENEPENSFIQTIFETVNTQQTKIEKENNIRKALYFLYYSSYKSDVSF